MIPKLSSDEYSFSIEPVEGGAVIVLQQVSTSKTKRFFLAGAHHDTSGLTSHMNSLTDDLCSQFFNEREKKVKAKKASA